MKFLNANTYGEALVSRGFEVLGSGHFATVYGKPGSDKVLKVGRAGAADGWLAYAAFARQSGSPYAPKIGRIKWHVGGAGSRWYVAVLERLHSTVFDIDDNRHPAKKQHRLASKILWRDQSAEAWAKEEEAANAPGLVAYMSEVRKLFDGIYDFDLHSANSMIRADGSLVITDPLSFGSTAGRYHEGDWADFRPEDAESPEDAPQANPCALVPVRRLPIPAPDFKAAAADFAAWEARLAAEPSPSLKALYPHLYPDAAPSPIGTEEAAFLRDHSPQLANVAA